MEAKTKLAEHVNELAVARRMLSRAVDSMRDRHQVSTLDRVQTAEMLLVEQVVEDLEQVGRSLSGMNVIECSMEETMGAHTPIVKAVDAVVSEHFGISEGDLRIASRRREIVDARQLAIYLVREIEPRVSWSLLANAYNRSDHSTAVHAYATISDRIEVEDGMAEMVSALLKRVQEELNPLQVMEA